MMHQAILKWGFICTIIKLNVESINCVFFNIYILRRKTLRSKNTKHRDKCKMSFKLKVRLGTNSLILNAGIIVLVKTNTEVEYHE